MRVFVCERHPERPIYAREMQVFECLNMYRQTGRCCRWQPLHLVVCKYCIAPTKAKSL